MTKKQRNKFYKKVLESLPCSKKYKYADEPCKGYSICRAIWNNLEHIEDEYEILSKLPELLIFEPKITLHLGYWLPLKDLKTRQIILEFCIAMTE